MKINPERLSKKQQPIILPVEPIGPIEVEPIDVAPEKTLAEICGDLACSSHQIAMVGFYALVRLI